MCERTGRVCLYSVETFLVVAACMLDCMNVSYRMADQEGFMRE